MNTDITTVLAAAAFALIGFIWGRVTAPHTPVAGGHVEVPKHFSEGDLAAFGGEGEVQVIVKFLEDGDFEGDTVFAFPGGQVQMTK